MTIQKATTYLLNDEPCYGLFELHMQSPGNRGFHRYQIIQVIRDDEIVEYREDLGLAENFEGVEQIRIPGGVVDYKTGRIDIVETVGRLKDFADSIRGMRPFEDYEDWKKFVDRKEKKITFA